MLTALPPSLFKCTGLVGVQAQENKLETLPDGDYPADLETLFLQDNAWKALPSGLAKCSKLKRVNVKTGDSVSSDTDALIGQLEKIVLGNEGGIWWGKDGKKRESGK